MADFGDLLKGFGVGVLAGIGAAFAIGIVRAGSYPSVAPGLAVAWACLGAYVALTFHAFRRDRTWFGFGLLVALLLAVPALTTACFPDIASGHPFSG